MISSLFSKARQKLLAILLLQSDREFYLRELIRLSRLGQGAVQREISSLVRAGIILRREHGNRVYYRANTGASIHCELKSIMIKTAGLADILRSLLLQAGSAIELAFIFGSFARGEENERSDIDLMVIGELSFNRVADLLASAQETLAREINPVVYTPREFKQKNAEGAHFCSSLVKEPKIFLIGDEKEFARLV